MYDDCKINELMNNPKIIRNSRKIKAAVKNAQIFIEIQKDCLSVVEILNNINGSEMPEALILNNGSLSHKELENDFMTIILLTIEVVMFNVEGFFGEKGLQSLTNSLQTNSKQ